MNTRLFPLVAFAALASAAAAAEPDWSQVDKAMGRSSATQAGGVHRYGFPRSDLNVTVDGVTLKPGFALGGWLAMLPMGSEVMAMGDLVLTDTEISPVMKQLIDHGYEVSAVHNHLLRSSIPVWYMHVSAHGRPEELARTLHDAMASTRLPPAAPAPASPPAIDLDTAALDAALHAKGAGNGGVYQFSFPRAETIRENGMDVPPTLGTAIAVNFQPTGGGKAAITGDFVLTAREVTPVLKHLRAQGIEVTALHSHMVGEDPRLYFMHFWANDDAARLAKSLRGALDLTNTKR